MIYRTLVVRRPWWREESSGKERRQQGTWAARSVGVDVEERAARRVGGEEQIMVSIL